MKPGESFISQPIRSLQTMLRVLAKDDPTLPTVVPDGIYGQDTMYAVSSFQRKHALPVTGITDQYTWEQIVECYEDANVRLGKAEPIEILFTPNGVFRKNEENPYLYLLQSMLTVLADDYPDINKPAHSGILDASTAEALAAFQILAGLPPTGELDKITWKYLVRHYMLQANRIARGL